MTEMHHCWWVAAGCYSGGIRKSSIACVGKHHRCSKRWRCTWTMNNPHISASGAHEQWMKYQVFSKKCHVHVPLLVHLCKTFRVSSAFWQHHLLMFHLRTSFSWLPCSWIHAINIGSLVLGHMFWSEYLARYLHPQFSKYQKRADPSIAKVPRGNEPGFYGL